MPCREHDLGTLWCENMVCICHSTQSLSAAHSSSSSWSEQSLQGNCLQFLEQPFQGSILCLSWRDEKYHLIAFFCAQIMIYQIRNVTENSEVLINNFFLCVSRKNSFGGSTSGMDWDNFVNGMFILSRAYSQRAESLFQSIFFEWSHSETQRLCV